nr:uncharacterized protein LOC118681846 [Bactrocera oleae]
MLTEKETKIFAFLFKILILYQFTIKYKVSPITLTGITTRVIDPNMVEQLEFILIEHGGITKLNGTAKHRGELQFIESELSIDLERQPKKHARIFYMKVDGCKFLKAKYKNNRLLEMVRKGLIHSQSFLTSCPLPPHHAFKVELLDISEMYPHFLPNVTFLMTGKVYTRGHLLWEMHVTGYSKDGNKTKNSTV